jgi:hypothetical protein
VPPTIYVMKIRPGRTADFEAFVAELMGPRRMEWAESHRRRGITRQVVCRAPLGGSDFAMIFSESDDSERAYAAIGASDHPFDRWLADRITDLFEPRAAVDTLADTAPRPGPWRGWRRSRR